MNANELLDVIGGTRDQYVMEAAATRQSRTVKKHGFRKPLLIAALIALMLALVGCAAVYVLHLQDMKIDENARTQNFNVYGQKLTEPTEIQEVVISLHGHNDNPVHQAAKEWYEYNQSLPEDLWMENNLNEKGLPENCFYTYECYTQDMVDKLNEIADKYDLKLLDKSVVAQRWQNQVMLDALGISGICHGEAKYGAGTFFPNGNFQLYADLPKDEWGLHVDVSCRFYYTQNDYFDPAYHGIDADFEQWNHTAPDGTELLLVMGEMGGYIFADRGDAFMSILVTGLYRDVILREGDEPFTREMMERIADGFDYQVRPQTVDMAAVQPKLDAAEEAYQAQQPVYEEPVYHSYGEYLNSLQWLDTLYYHLADITGDGAEELLIGDGSGTFHTVYTMENGQAQCLGQGGPFKLCENGYIEDHVSEPESMCEYFTFGKWEDFGTNREVKLQYTVDGWGKGYYPLEPITEEEAQAIRDKYVPLDVEFKSVLIYPMDENGTTLAQVAREQDPYLTEQDIIKLYADLIPNYRSIFKLKYYALRDINNDGVIDLLLSDNTESVCEIMTINRGDYAGLHYSRFYLCEDNVIETNNPYFRPEQGGNMDNHSYFKLDGNKHIYLDKVRHCVSDGTWGINDDGPEISKEDAMAIIGKYKRINPGMKPLRELVYGQ